MRKRNNTRQNSRGKRQHRTPISWSTILITLFCAALFLSSAFLAASLHFSSITYGMQNSELRNQLEDLEAETRRLMLAKEMAMAPGRIKEVALDHGFRERNISDTPIVLPVRLAEIVAEDSKPKPENAVADEKPVANTETDGEVSRKPARATSERAAKNEDTAEPERAKVVRTKMTIGPKSGKPAARPRSAVKSERHEKPAEPTKEKDINERPRVVSVAKLR